MTSVFSLSSKAIKKKYHQSSSISGSTQVKSPLSTFPPRRKVHCAGLSVRYSLLQSPQSFSGTSIWFASLGYKLAPLPPRPATCWFAISQTRWSAILCPLNCPFRFLLGLLIDTAPVAHNLLVQYIFLAQIHWPSRCPTCLRAGFRPREFS